jgi:hypothetical protein
MAIRYIGAGNLTWVDVMLLGDGTSTSVAIDLTQAPFDLNFQGNYPIALSHQTVTGEQPSSVTISGSGILQFQYANPIPAMIDLPSLTPRYRVKVGLIYG